jgi:type I restriction enzyme S subunit
MSFPRYPKYKASGVEWLGDVPGHWDVVQFKQFVEIENGQDHKHVEQDEGYPVLGSGGVFTYASDFLYDGESVLLGRKGTIDKPLHITGRFWTVDTMYWTKIKPNASGRFAYYLAVTIPFDYYSTNTALPSMTQSALKGHFVAQPPLPEQTRIAAFLDRETAKIDELVVEQRRLMELLKEKRQAVISHAVTRGLNPKAPLKPSGIEWIGEIPEHWEVKKLKYLINIQAGYAFKSSAYSQKDTDIRLLRGINVNPGQINWNDTVYWPHDKLREVSDFMLDSDDMVMGMDRPWVGAGVRIARITETDLPALLLQRVARIRATGIEPDYLERTLTGSGFKAYFEPILTGVSVPHISPDQIACYVAAVPPKAEQIKICKFIKEAESLGAKTARAAEAQIESLKTLRSTLIAHAVTGRIKV